MIKKFFQSPRGKSLEKSSETIIEHNLWKKILIGMALGVGTGLLLSPSGAGLLPADIAYTLGDWLKLPGTIFLALISMVIVPLVVCSIILGISESGSLEMVKQQGTRILLYFVGTTTVAITIGMILVSAIQPGTVIDRELIEATMSASETSTPVPAQTFDDLTIPERIANILPTNPAKAQVDRNMLQIVIASILIGIALLTVRAESVKTFRDLCVAGQVLSMRIISWAMMIAPYAVFGLLSNITIRIGFDAILGVGYYMVTVLAGLGCMACVYLLIVRFISRRPVGAFMKGIREAQLLAFSTSSSAATMPFSIQAAEEKLHIRPEITRFVIPLGATINMDGTALYQAIAALFLCQVFGIDLSFGQTVILLLTTVGASIGTPATPGVGIIVLATIITGIGVPAEGIALIIGVDRLLDMCRTTINVTGDLTATTVMERWLPEKTHSR